MTAIITKFEIPPKEPSSSYLWICVSLGHGRQGGPWICHFLLWPVIMTGKHYIIILSMFNFFCFSYVQVYALTELRPWCIRVFVITVCTHNFSNDINIIKLFISFRSHLFWVTFLRKIWTSLFWANCAYMVDHVFKLASSNQTTCLNQAAYKGSGIHCILVPKMWPLDISFPGSQASKTHTLYSHCRASICIRSCTLYSAQLVWQSVIQKMCLQCCCWEAWTYKETENVQSGISNVPHRVDKYVWDQHCYLSLS